MLVHKNIQEKWKAFANEEPKYRNTILEPDLSCCVSPFADKCDELPSLADGEMFITTDGRTTIVTYYCELGFSMSGDSSAACDINGLWNATRPSCGKNTSR